MRSDQHFGLKQDNSFNTVFFGAAAACVFVVFGLAYHLGGKSQVPAETNLEARMKQLQQHRSECAEATKSLRKSNLKASSQGESMSRELETLEKQNTDLQDENQVLNDQNNQLIEELQQLKWKLEDRSFISTDTSKALSTLAAKNTSSAAMKRLAESRDVKKGQVMAGIIEEVRQCKGRADAAFEFVSQRQVQMADVAKLREAADLDAKLASLQAANEAAERALEEKHERLRGSRSKDSDY